MTSITEIQELARTLNLQNIAKGIIDLSHDKESNLTYLKDVLQKEVNKREEFAVLRREKAGRLPKKEFMTTNINSGIAWQIERLEELERFCKNTRFFIVSAKNKPPAMQVSPQKL